MFQSWENGGGISGVAQVRLPLRSRQVEELLEGDGEAGEESLDFRGTEILLHPGGRSGRAVIGGMGGTDEHPLGDVA